MLPAPSHPRALETSLALLLVLVLAPAALAYDARLAWSPVAGSSGYKVYVREASGSFGAGTDVGALPTDGDGAVHFTLAGVNLRTTSYFAVSTYDGAGN